MFRICRGISRQFIPAVYKRTVKSIITSQRHGFSSVPLSSLLSNQQKSIIRDEKSIFDELHGYLQQIDAQQSDIDLVIETKSRVDDVFLVVIVGEFNAGKSSFINALLGEKYLKVGVLPTTSKIGILRSQPESGVHSSGIWKKSEKIMLDDVEELDLPVGWLNHVALIDTPGTNAIIEKHEALTLNIVPRSDLVLFVTSAERPITESERDFLSKIQKWGKKVIVIVNKIDLLRSKDDRDQVLTFVSQNVGNILGSTMPVRVFGISSTDGLQSKQIACRENVHPSVSVSARQWAECGLGALEDYLKSELGRNELIRNKLQNPLMLADRILADAINTVQARLIGLESDQRILSTIDLINAQFNEDLDRDLEIYRSRAKTIISQILESTDTYLSQNVSLLKAELLLNPARLQENFVSSVVIDAEKNMKNLAIEMSDLLATRTKAQARQAVEYLGNRSKKYQGTGSAAPTIHESRFENIRTVLVERLTQDMRNALTKYDHRAEIEVAGHGLRSALFLTSGASLTSLLGAGYIATVGDLSLLTDAIGVGALGCTSLASTGIIAWRKSHARKEMKDRLLLLGDQLDLMIKNNFQSARQQANEGITDGVAPYTRFIKAETLKLTELESKMNGLRVKIREVRANI